MADNNNSDQGNGSGDAGAQDASFGEPVVSGEAQDQGGDQGAGDAGKTDDQATGDQAGQDGGAQDQGDQAQDGAEAGKTDKGTKLDPDPLSQANQLRANAERDAKSLAALLGNPKQLIAFMEKQHGIKIPAPTEDGGNAAAPVAPDFKEVTEADLDDLPKVAGIINGLQKALSESKKSNVEEIKQLRTQVNSLVLGGKAQALYTKASDEVAQLRSEPELTKDSPDFIDGLDEEIAQEYHKLDFDEETGFYRGQHSIKDIGDRMIAVARKSRKSGSDRAQTVVKDKSRGQVRTSPTVDDKSGDDNSDPASSIAKGIAGRTFVS